MKSLFFSALMLIVPLISEARESVSHAGIYEKCVRWTTYNGMETSKKFALELKEDDSISFVISFFRGSSVCDSENVEILAEYRNFKILEDFGRGYPARIMTVHEIDKNLYFNFMFTGDSISACSSETLPVKYDLTRSIFLEKVKN